MMVAKILKNIKDKKKSRFKNELNKSYIEPKPKEKVLLNLILLIPI